MTDSEGNEIGKLFVGGLSQATNNGSLRLYFSRFGEVDDAVVMMDNKTGRSRGFGYVKFRESESVTLALEAKPHILDGKEVDAKQCNVNMKGRNRRSLKIFVGGIGLDQDVDSIKHYFKQFGRVTDVNLMMDSNKQRHRGFAFVGFEDEAVVKRLISLHYVTMNNKQVEIKAMEPPNFGRKVVQAPCMATTTVLGASPSGDTCAHAYDTTTDPGTLISGSLNVLNSAGNYGPHHHQHHHSYLSSQTPTLQCTQHNLLTQTRTNPSIAYEHQHHANYGGSMLSDALYPSTAYLQPLSPNQHSLRTAAEAILPPGSTTTTFGTNKQPVPFILSNGQLHQANGVIGFPPNAASVYTAFPCQLVPPTPIVASHPNAASAVGTLVGAEKSTIGGWATNNLHAATHLTLCPPQIGTQPGLLSCSQFTPNISTPVGAPNPAGHEPNTPGTGSMLAPYYAVCPPYTTIHLQPDHSGSTSHFAMGPVTQNTTGMMNNGLTACGIPPGSQSGAGDTAILPIQTATAPMASKKVSSSRPTSSTPTAEMKSDATNGKPSTYPATTTIVMPTSNVVGYPSGTVMPPSSSSVNLGQALWNPSPSNMVYSSVPVSWGYSSTNQPVSGQSWPSAALPVISQQQQQTAVAANIPQSTLKLNGSVGSGRRMNNECSSTSKEISVDSSVVPSAKASGDSLDGIITSGEHVTAYSRSEINADTAYPCGKPQTDSALSVKDTARSGDKVSELNTWQVDADGSPNDQSNSRNSVALPSWNNRAGNPTSGNSTRWTEYPHGPVTNVTNYPVSTNMIIHPHSWNLPLELMDDNLTSYDASVNRTNSFNSMPSRRNNNVSLSHLGRTVPHTTNYQCQNGILNKQSPTDTGKSDQLSNGLLSNNNYSRLPQRMSTYNTQSSSTQRNGQQSPVQGHLNNSESNDEKSSSTCNLTSSELGTPHAAATAATTPTPTPNSTRMDYGSWVYANNTASGHLETGGDGKELQSPATIGVELGMSAGAAGDYQTGHFSSYHLTH